MVVHGREISFLRSVGANCAIDELTGGNWDTYFADNSGYAAGQRFSARFMEILSTAAEDAKVFEIDGYIKRPLTTAEAMTLDDETFNALFQEAMSAWKGEKPTVEVKQISSKKKAVKKELSA